MIKKIFGWDQPNMFVELLGASPDDDRLKKIPYADQCPRLLFLKSESFLQVSSDDEYSIVAQLQNPRCEWVEWGPHQVHKKFIDINSSIKDECLLCDERWIEEELKKLEREAEKEKRFRKLKSKYRYLFQGENKFGTHFFVMADIDEDKLQEPVNLYREISVNVYLFDYDMRPKKHKLYATRKTYADKDYIWIDDIQCARNQGYGSLLLRGIQQIAKEWSLPVAGYLSEADQDRFDVHEHFYQKHGFQVRFNQHRTSGKIWWDPDPEGQ